jgi:glycosyltransferase involved in cell wall biosynthesis
MACGLPCVATPVGGILDFIKDRETGMYAEVRNHQSIANAIMELVRNPDLVSKIKRQSFEMVKEKYDWELIAKDMKKVFETM